MRSMRNGYQEHLHVASHCWASQQWHPLLPSPQNLLHRLPLRQLIDQLVQPPNLLHQRVGDFFDADAADDALDLRGVGMEGGGFGEEGLEVGLPFDLPLQAGGAVAGQPADDLVDFRPRAVFAFRLLDVERIDLGERHCEDAMRHRGGSSGGGASRL